MNKGDRTFGSDGNDTFDARDGQGGNRISGGLGDDTFYLGSNDRALGGDGKDIFRVGLGGGNLISGGAGADQFWIVNAELPSSANTVLDFQLGRLHAQNMSPYFYEKVHGTDVFGVNYGNTNNFSDNPSKNTQN
ncbi:hypothetical protein H6F99_06510 [Aphanizomenon flos-aquae FACHB-1040]|uniref:Uncharacterized protein n=1 Tax=Aphanizomenon flos-aquae FACHB-1040 TaxID=2692887 RepID=A0ABR8BT31_APHFL|nr:hypothetical protein [Aphanizomenon flos-aquae FACHB-1040]